VLHKNKKYHRGFKSGFTLIELIIVMGIIVILMSMAFASMASSSRYFKLSTAYEKIVQMVREVRSDAITGKAQPDWTDYDQDNLYAVDGDLVTPAGYGIYFDPTKKTVTMFADVRKSTHDLDQNEGVYDAPTGGIGTYNSGSDVILATYKIDSSLTLVTDGGPDTIIYTPIFADTILNPSLNTGSHFFIFGVSNGTEDTAGVLHKCSKIHPVAGVPEVATDDECPYSNA
jgi:prepilin-type N-terminal cleavage/methylation domain-containing protein